MSEAPSVAIVMPAYNAAHLLPKTLTAAMEAAEVAGGQKVVVVDPGSTDNTTEVAKKLGAQVITLPKRAGPAHARNVGVKEVDSDVVLFIDSDCVAHSDVVTRVQETFRQDPSMVSVTGSYDDTPPERNFASLYMNLRHHFTHQKARTEGASFWAGCGAVRRETYEQIGGFDAEQFPMPMIEDIELGLRLKPLGPTKLDPGLQVKHLKKWTMRSVIETDIKCRALPWGRIIVKAGKLPNDLNLRWSQRVAAVLSPFVLLGVPVVPLATVTGQLGLAAVMATPVATSLMLHREMIAAFTRIEGVSFALRAWLFHQVHLLYSTGTMAYCTAEHLLKR